MIFQGGRGSRGARGQCAWAVLLFFSTTSAFAAQPPASRPGSKPGFRPGFRKEEAEIPKTPSPPQNLDMTAPADHFRCQRSFTYQGKTYSCDSNIRLDGENLRPILRTVPEAVSELDDYQKTRRQVRAAAYVGTLGVIVMIAGALFSLRYREAGVATDLSSSVRNTSLWIGGGIAAGSFVTALSLVKGNEERLNRAVDRFNAANPEEPIQLQFTTGFSF